MRRLVSQWSMIRSVAREPLAVIQTSRCTVALLGETNRSEHRMLGLDNPIHILFLLVIVLLVFGAKRLPEMGKSLGEGLRGFKDSVSGDAHLSHMTSAQDPPPVDALPAATPVPAATPMTTAPVPEAAAEWASEPRPERTPVTPAA
jgi:sec-independent protein translocase protein TatA